MKLAINPTFAAFRMGGTERIEMKDAFKLCLDAGFTEFDFTPDVTSDDWEAKTAAYADELAKLGCVVHQTHAPFNRYKKAPVEEHQEQVRRVIKASAMMGAKYVVIHADEFPAGEEWTQEKALTYNVDYFRPLVEYAKTLGITAAIENLFEDGRPERDRYTSLVEEVIAVMDAYAEYGAGCCWDFGHGHVSYGKQDVEALKKVAGRAVCTHVHDNHYGKDLHQFPFCGDIDWTASMSILKDAGYDGNLSLELVYGRFPESLKPEMLRFVYGCARELEEMMK
ncbi:MAG: sugar phosphate isomerase/epimerase [Clostridia bacterium]|nr:sugar phosphate isomerase/epimerase [Clostridia bacterium]